MADAGGAAEADQPRIVSQNSPHSPECNGSAYRVEGRDQFIGCTCWIWDVVPPAATEADVKLAAIDASYTDFESTGDLHELARAVGVILDRREGG